jgi:hypothetical protein
MLRRPRSNPACHQGHSVLRSQFIGVSSFAKGIRPGHIHAPAVPAWNSSSIFVAAVKSKGLEKVEASDAPYLAVRRLVASRHRIVPSARGLDASGRGALSYPVAMPRQMWRKAEPFLAFRDHTHSAPLGAHGRNRRCRSSSTSAPNAGQRSSSSRSAPRRGRFPRARAAVPTGRSGFSRSLPGRQGRGARADPRPAAVAGEESNAVAGSPTVSTWRPFLSNATFFWRGESHGPTGGWAARFSHRPGWRIFACPDQRRRRIDFGRPFALG